MKYITNIIKNLLSKEIKPLGRWKIEKSKKQINKIIDLSNEDHCGTCSQYALSKIKNTKPECKSIK
jgi:hypothetical protein